MTASARIPLELVETNAKNLELTRDEEGVYHISNLTGSSYIYTSHLPRPIHNDTESRLEFEYKIDCNMMYYRVYYTTTVDVSYTMLGGGECEADTWIKASVDISKHPAKWGNYLDKFRITFNVAAGSTIQIRNLYLTNGEEDDTEDVTPEMCIDEVYDVISNLGLPLVCIETVDGVMPTYEVANPPAGCEGQSIKNAIKVPGQVTVLEPDGSVRFDSGEYSDEEVTGMTIKVRGNTSVQYEQKPYKIKLKQKGDMLGRGDDKYNDKNWVLIADDNCRTDFYFNMCELMEVEYVPAREAVNVWMNGDYKGRYLLVEGVERNPECRVNVPKTGFITEMDLYWWNEDGMYLPSSYAPRYGYTFKYPDYEDIDPIALDDLQQLLLAFEQSVTGGGYDEYIDVESFAKYLLIHDIMGTWDGYGTNKYFAIDDLDSPVLRMPVIWDIDSSQGVGVDKWSNVHAENIFKNLFNNNINPVFAEEYIAQWYKYKHQIIPDMDCYIGYSEYPDGTTSKLYDEDYQAALDASMAYNQKKNGRTGQTLLRTRQRISEWLEERIDALEEKIMQRRNELLMTNVERVDVSANVAGEIEVFDLSGRRVIAYDSDGLVSIMAWMDSALEPGIYIVKTGTGTLKHLVK